MKRSFLIHCAVPHVKINKCHADGALGDPESGEI